MLNDFSSHTLYSACKHDVVWLAGFSTQKIHRRRESDSLRVKPDRRIVDSGMETPTITKGRYTYVHDESKGHTEAIDVHHIVVRRSRARVLIFCVYPLLFAIVCFPVLLLLRDKSVSVIVWSFIIAGLFVRLSLRTQVRKESVIILPAFGVQLETFYMSGRTVRRFVPIDKILKPVLNECVTPVTCYWSLSLIISGQEELLLAFKELYPPVSMLVPIWKALCAAISCEECTNKYLGGDTRQCTDK